MAEPGRPSSTPFLIGVMGPTASGKSALAEALAAELDAVLLNADAFQVYRGLDIGTAKPADRANYRLLDLIEPTESFGVGAYVGRAAEVLADLFGERRSAVVVGGTGLYVRALFEGYAEMRPPPDPELRAQLEADRAANGLGALVRRLEALDPKAAGSIDLQNPVRVRRALERALDPRPGLRVEIPNFRRFKVAIVPKPEITSARIDSRLDFMVYNGWVDEVRRLMGEGNPREAPGLRAIGYRSLYDHLLGMVSLPEAIETIRAETRQYAKRQRTWLRSEPNLTVLPDCQTAEQALSETMKLIAHR